MGSPQEQLLVVVDPRDDRHVAFERALITSQLRAIPPRLNIFIFPCRDRTPVSEEGSRLTCDQRWFDVNIHQPLAKLNLDHSISISWDPQWPQQLIRGAAECEADMILLPVPDGSRRLLDVSAARWDLLKYAPCPVVLVRPGASEKRKTLLAAVNLQAEAQEQRALNVRILEFAKRVASRYGAELHVVNAYLDTMHYPDRGNLVRTTGLVPQRIHVQQGYTDEVVGAVARETGADMVVMGTLNQRGTKGSIRRGNTAARVIAALSTDTLVVN